MEHTRRALGMLAPFEREGYSDEHSFLDAMLTEIVSLLSQRAEAAMPEREPRFAEVRGYLMQSSILAQDARDFLTRHRTLQQFWDRSASKVRSYRERRQIVSDAFEATVLRMEQGDSSLVDLDPDVLHELEMVAADTIWKKASRRLTHDADLDGALTLTRTLLETVFKKIIEEHGETYSSGDTLANLCKRCLGLVIPLENSSRERFKQFSRGVLNMMDNISLYRASEGDAHGTPFEKEIEAHEAAYAVNLAGATALFFIECHRTTRH